MTLADILQTVNVLLIPTLYYLVRIEKRLARLEVLQDVQDKENERLERRIEVLEGHPATV